MRNPKWTVEEHILALDLYMRCPEARGSSSHPEVVKLSKTLDSLPIHDPTTKSPKFRNPAGVAMKLSNFRRCDPSYDGEGLSRGASLEFQIWEDYADNLENLSADAKSIVDSGGSLTYDMVEKFYDDDKGVKEGNLRKTDHTRRERNSSLGPKKKAKVFRETGKLECEACGVDYYEKYGKFGMACIQAHHEVPLSQRESGTLTKLSDLRLYCANCHNILHHGRGKDFLSHDELKEVVSGKG